MHQFIMTPPRGLVAQVRLDDADVPMIIVSRISIR
jgi:hypothetical protein